MKMFTLTEPLLQLYVYTNFREMQKNLVNHHTQHPLSHSMILARKPGQVSYHQNKFWIITWPQAGPIYPDSCLCANTNIMGTIIMKLTAHIKLR